MAVLTSKRAKMTQNDFSGGQNSADDAANILQNQAQVLQNCIITRKGRTTERLGLTRVGDNPATLISHWTFDASDATDDKASNDGTASNITYVDGKFGKCASFNGTTSSISVSADTTIDSTDMVAFRISVWVYADSDGENDVGSIVDKFSTNVGYKLWVNTESSSTVKLSFQVGYGAGTTASLVTSTTMSTGAWHKIDAVHHTDKSSDIYIDGALASYGTDTDGVGTIGDDSAVDLYIGNNSAGTATFDGEIDDVRIYDGSFTIDDTEQKVILGITHFDVGTTYDKLIRAKNTDIQELNTNFLTWDNITGLTGMTTGLTTNFVQATDRLFILNGTDNVFSIDSALSVTDEGDTNADPPLTTFGTYASNNRLFLSGSKTQADRDIVWFSNSLAPQTFIRDTNYFKVRSGGGGKTTWLKMFKEFELIIYKDDSIYVLNMDGATPLSDWDLKPLSTVIGCPAGRTVADIGNDHIFLANDGVRLLSRTTFDKLRVGVISDPVRDIIDSINQDAIETSNGWFENGLYILNIPTGTSTVPDRTLIWDSIAAVRNGDPNSGWTTVPKATWNLSCMSSYGFGDYVNTFVGGSSEANSLCYKVLNGTTDNGAAIVQQIITKEQDFDEAFLEKIFDPGQFIAETGSDAIYLVEMKVDDGSWVTVGQMSLSGGLVTPFTTPATTVLDVNSTHNFRTKFGGRGHYVTFRISNSEINTTPTYLEYTVYARPYQGRI